MTGSAAIWVIEYASSGDRRNDHRVRLRDGAFSLDFDTGPDTECVCIAARIEGAGSLALGGLVLEHAPSSVPVTPSQHRRKGVHVARGDQSDAFHVIGSPESTAELTEVAPIVLAPPPGARADNTFDRLGVLLRPGEVYRLWRLYPRSRCHQLDNEFDANQLELHWQHGTLAGIVIDPADVAHVDAEILRWLEDKAALLVWEAKSDADLHLLADGPASQITSPIATTVPGANDTTHWLLEQFPNLSVLGCGLGAGTVVALAAAHPGRILPASGSSADRPSHALPDGTTTLVRILEQMERKRRRALNTGVGLRFPALPVTESDLRNQGFVVVSDTKLPTDEDVEAKSAWSEWGVKSFYEDYKPWAGMIADLVGDLGCRRILEFGCNVGRNLHTIQEAHPSVEVVGIDINKEAIDAGRAASGMDLRHGDEHALRDFADAEFDLVFTVSVLDHIPIIDDICRELVRCASRYAYFLEVRLPIEGKVLRHYDHRHGGVRESTAASYSWHLDRVLESIHSIEQLDRRRVYLHSSQLGPYYEGVLAHLRKE